MTVENPDLIKRLVAAKKEIAGLAKNRAAGEPPLDLRLEVVLAELSYQGLDPLRDVMIHTWSLFERDYRSDVDLEDDRIVIGDARSLDQEKRSVKVGNSSIANAKDDKSEWEYDDVIRQTVFINLVTHRDGLYDYLPEGLFHQPVNKTRDRDQSDWVNEIEQQFEREQAARRFFQPIEQEFYHQRLLLEFEERKYLLTEESLRQNEGGEIFRTFWQLPSGLLSIRQLNNLLHLLPIAQRITGDLQLLTQTFELILGLSVKIAIVAPLTYLIPADAQVLANEEISIGPEPFELGRLSLGGFALGGMYQDTMPAMQIVIGPLNTDQFSEFLPGGRSRQILDLLEGYFIPAETTVISHILPDSSSEFLLFDGTSNSVLGFNAFF